MPPVELRLPAASLPPTPEHVLVHGWGGGEPVAMSALRPASVEEVLATVIGNGEARRGLIARGMGRSYGDAAQLRGGRALDMRRMKAFELDRERGDVTAQAGVTLRELLGQLVPVGWMVPVVPGTQHVTVGGAIASDIHGKNHGGAGTFGSHVRAMGLVTGAGELLELEPHDPLFQATLGGMGLTGVIVWARFALRLVAGPLLSVDTDRVQGLDEALDALRAPGGPHRVAWLDLLGSRRGRGVVTRAEHLDAPVGDGGPRGTATVAARARVPESWPQGLLRESTIRVYNALRFRRTPRRERGRVESIGSHMFPLDGLEAWPRLYGRPGFVQYQLVIPYGAERALESVISILRRFRVPCFLAVLKDFGPANEAPLSFPIAGWTLALDLPRAADRLQAALEECDRVVVESGGRVYLTKDSRLRADTVRAMYPRLEEWRGIRDQVDPEQLWRSDLALRTGLVAGETR